MSSNIVAFEQNVPVQLAVKYSSPQLFHTAKGQRARFSCVDGRTLFLDPEVAASIPQMGIRPRELFNICLRSGERGDAKRWDIWREKNGASDSPKPAPHQEGMSSWATTGAVQENGSNPGQPLVAPLRTQKSLAHSGYAVAVREQTNALIDIFADCCKYASEHHGDVVSRDDVRCLLMNRLISGGRR